jgi:hypothetical protein
MTSREVLLVGGVPLRPAAAVFETVANALGPFLPRIPDGDQRGWILAAVESFSKNEALEQTGFVELSGGGVQVPTFGLRAGRSAAHLRLGPYGYGEVARSSYADFKALRDRGAIPPETRFQVTMPGPGTSAFMVQLPAEELLPIARAALAEEIRQIAAVVPAEDLAVQIDIAMEAEHEEYRRRPDAFDTPVHETFDWTQEQMAESAAWLADHVPAEAELGFHICSIWHHYQPGGQDNAVIVSTANAVTERVERRVDYQHLPTSPEHDEDEFAPLRDLHVPRETTVYLGVIHRSDGVEGAKRRIAAAKTALPEFGVASFCGLGNPGAIKPPSDVRVGEALHEELRTGGSDLEDVLDLHRAVATLDVG